ncbi:MAG: YncE family protein [Nitrospiraceae bacterium]|nr:MAG: YncE family protein [Nitrospiraceae bacterium]
MQNKFVCPAYNNFTGPFSFPFISGGQWAFLALLVFSLFFSGCQLKSALLIPVASEETDNGEVFLYLQPFPQEADRLRFSIEEASAVRDDGAVIPLLLSISEFRGRDMKRQRLIASGWLPPGQYRGFSFRVRNASLEVEEGEANLLVPEGPVMAEFPFDIRREKSYVMWLKFNYRQSITGGVAFSPSLSVFLPERPVAALLGYVANHDSNNITVFDKKSMQVIGVITSGKGPGGIAIEKDRRRAYVTLEGDDSVDVIDMTSGEVINNIKLSPGDGPREPAFTPDRRILLTVNTRSDTVSVLDPSSLIELTRITVGNGPNSVVVDPAGRRAYAFNTISSTISVIDLASRSVAATISTEPGPLRGQFNREGNRLYVVHEWSSFITVIDPFSLSVLSRVRAGIGLNTIKLDTRTNLLYVSKKDGPMIEVYDPISAVPVDYITGDASASYMTIDSEENNLFMVVPETKTVIIVDIISKKIIGKIDVGMKPAWVTMMGER